MAYADNRTNASPASLAAVIGLHAAAGAFLIAGFSVAGVIAEGDKRFVAIPLPKDPPPPPPPKPIPDPSANTPMTPPIFVPKPDLNLVPAPPRIPTTDLFPPPMPPSPIPGPTTTPGPIVPPSVPSVAPVGASPRNDPGRWVTDADYRSAWIRRDMAGTARFRLEIAANGAVTDCTVTSSTGHEALDTATCSLIQRRAKFQPARGSEGEPVAGSFESSILWRLPQ